jgi:hypothetical protein
LGATEGEAQQMAAESRWCQVSTEVIFVLAGEGRALSELVTCWSKSRLLFWSVQFWKTNHPLVPAAWLSVYLCFPPLCET